MKIILRFDTIVRVCATDCLHHGYQGQVVGFDRSDRKSPVRVWFGREIDHIHRAGLCGTKFLSGLPEKHSVEPPSRKEQARDPRTWNFSSRELVVCSAWTVKTLAERHYPRSHHSYYELEEGYAVFVPNTRDCDVEGCVALATRRILTNVWGTVFTADVCEHCAPTYHLKCGEVFPWKRRECARA